MAESTKKTAQKKSRESDPDDEVKIGQDDWNESEYKLAPNKIDSLPPVSEWPNRPCLLMNMPREDPSELVTTPLGVPFEINSELFEGIALKRFRGSNSNDVDADNNYFNKRNRKFLTVIQGRFKEEVSTYDVFDGVEMSEPLKRLPPRLIVRTLEKVLRFMSPGIQVDLAGSEPKVFNFLGSFCRIISVDKPGSEPDITGRDHVENSALFGGQLSSGKISDNRRKRLLSKKNSGFKFETDKVYTFVYYDHLMDYANYKMSVYGITNLDLAKTIGRQYITTTARTRDGRVLWRFQFIHEKLLKEKA